MKQASRFTIQPSWQLLITDLGLNPAHVLRLAGLPADLFTRRELKISAGDYFRLWHGLEQAAGTDSLPIQIGQRLSVEAFDPPIFASLCSRHFNLAIQRLALFKRLVGPLSFDVELTAKETTITVIAYGTTEPIPQSLGLAELVFLVQLARIGTRKHIIPRSVTTAYYPANHAAYHAYFGVALSHGPMTQLSISVIDAEQPFLTENTPMWDFFEAGLLQKLADLDQAAPMSTRVQSVLQEMLPAGQSSIEEAADRLAISKRTLQRQLAAEALSYQVVLNNTRKALAEVYLRRSTISLNEIAYLVGFQDSNSFIRAFRGWTGQTPGDYRINQQA